MAESENTRSVVAAIVGNLLIAITKGVAAVFSGSAAMLAETIHSFVDTGNGALLLLGIHRSHRPPDDEHPLGYAHELYFWTLVVGILIFGLGGGISIVTGIVHVVHHTPPEDHWWTYAVLGAAAVFEGGSWYFGLKAFRAERRGRGIVETIRLTKNPTAFMVLLEDSAALAGLVLAFFGVWLSARLDLPWIDGAFSIAIGALLCSVAVLMVYESMGLLVGEGMDERALGELRSIVRSEPRVERVGDLLTLYLGPDDILLAIELRMAAGSTIEDVRRSIAAIKRRIRARFPRIRHIYLDTLSTQIDDVQESTVGEDPGIPQRHERRLT